MNDEIAKLVEELMTAGCMPKVAARVVTQAFVAGMAAAPSRDPAAEKRRAWDREYRRRRDAKRKSGGSGGDRVELAATQWLWTEGQGLLRQLGASEKQARVNIGRWMKAGHDPAAIKQLVVEVHQKGIGDPVPWVTKALGNAKGRPNGAGHRTTAAAADDLIARAEEFERTRDPGRPDRPR
jgi:hypothetical protein